jgi:hypothetical protein
MDEVVQHVHWKQTHEVAETRVDGHVWVAVRLCKQAGDEAARAYNQEADAVDQCEGPDAHI